MNHRVGCVLLLLAGCLACPSSRSLAASPPARAAIVATFADGHERFWRRIADQPPYDTLGAREVFAYALALCESRQHADRLARLLELGAAMQDRDPHSATYGNLWWTWRDGKVTDQNAVEFCGQDALHIWLRHRDWLPPPDRDRLREFLAFALTGCLQHRVPTDYTNIALLNAGNLIVLGEALGRDDAAGEGYRRLDGVCLWTWQFGTHEFCSPTYYAPDLNGLLLIRQYAGRESGRRAAAALWEMLWTDIAANWFPPAGRLAGPHSRSYDYLRGLGATDGHLILNGWLADQPVDQGELLHSALLAGPPPQRLMALSQRFPRAVRQSWGLAAADSRTHLLYPDVTLGCTGAIYGAAKQDMPLTVDLPGERTQVRCYFIADGREDPYGQRRYETSSARHMKALHLAPFWAASQRGGDALALVVYRPEDLKGPEVFNVQSHFVLRRAAHGLWLRGQKLEVPQGVPDAPARVAIGLGDPLIARYGTAAVGLRVVWARRQDGSPATAELVDDGNRFGAMRLTVDHRSPQPTTPAAAALWVAVGSQLTDTVAFDAWRHKFESAHATATADAQQIRVDAQGHEGPLAVVAAEPFGNGGRVELQPAPSRAVLEIDGHDVGRPLLDAVPCIRDRPAGPTVERPLAVPATGVAWEAESGLIFPGQCVHDDPAASGGKYLAQTKDDLLNRALGPMIYPLRLAKAGPYFLWARTIAVDSDSDSFFVRVIGKGQPPRAAWHLRHSETWQWQRVTFDNAQQPTPLLLPAGDCLLHLQGREYGAKLDRLFLTPDADAKPE